MKVTVEHARLILGERYKDLSDEEIADMLETLYHFGKKLIEIHKDELFDKKI